MRTAADRLGADGWWRALALSALALAGLGALVLGMAPAEAAYLQRTDWQETDLDGRSFHVDCTGSVEGSPSGAVLVHWSCTTSDRDPLLNSPPIEFTLHYRQDAEERYKEVRRTWRRVREYREHKATAQTPETGELTDCGDESGVHPSVWEPEATLTEQYSSSGSLSWGDSYYSSLAGYSYDPYAR